MLCREGIEGPWEFTEWAHGQTGRPMGKAYQAWSAASYVAAYLRFQGDTTLEVPDTYPQEKAIAAESGVAAHVSDGKVDLDKSAPPA